MTLFLGSIVNERGTTKHIVLALLPLTCCGLAHAEDHGTWYCQECFTQRDTAAPVAAGEAIAFFRATVNASANNSPWNPADTVELCDGDTCYVYVFKMGTWYYSGVSTSDPNRYENQHDWGPREGHDAAIYTRSGIINGGQFSFFSGTETWIITCTVGGHQCGA